MLQELEVLRPHARKARSPAPVCIPQGRSNSGRSETNVRARPVLSAGLAGPVIARHVASLPGARSTVGLGWRTPGRAFVLPAFSSCEARDPCGDRAGGAAANFANHHPIVLLAIVVCDEAFV